MKLEHGREEMSEWNDNVTVGEMYQFLKTRVINAKIKLGELAIEGDDLLGQKGITVGAINDLDGFEKIVGYYAANNDDDNP